MSCVRIWSLDGIRRERVRPPLVRVSLEAGEGRRGEPCRALRTHFRGSLRGESPTHRGAADHNHHQHVKSSIHRTFLINQNVEIFFTSERVEASVAFGRVQSGSSTRRCESQHDGLLFDHINEPDKISKVLPPPLPPPPFHFPPSTPSPPPSSHLPGRKKKSVGGIGPMALWVVIHLGCGRQRVAKVNKRRIPRLPRLRLN